MVTVYFCRFRLKQLPFVAIYYFLFLGLLNLKALLVYSMFISILPYFLSLQLNSVPLIDSISHLDSLLRFTMPGLFDPPKGRKHQPLRRKREYTPSPLSQVTTPDAVHASKRSLAISALVEALQPPTKRKRDREDKILDSDISLAPERIPVVGMVKTRGFKTLERRKKPLERKPNKISRVIRQRKSRRRREKSLNFEMTPTAIEKIENLAQIIMSGFPRCNHPLWKRTPRSTVISEMEMPPAACIPSPLEQMRRQDREFNKAKPDTDAKDNVKPDLNPW